MFRECGDEDGIISNLILNIDAEHIFPKSWNIILVEAVILTSVIWWSFVRDYVWNN